VRQEILHKIPESLSFEEAALTEPFCVAHHALVDRICLSPGDTVAVIGPGPVGLTSLQIAKVQGAGRTILIGNDASGGRMDGAKEERWADEVINVDQQDPVEAVMEFTHGEGADVVIDAAGNSQALKTSLNCVRRLGQIVKVGWGPEPFNHSLDTLLRKSATLAGTFGHNRHNWQAELKLLGNGKLRARPLIAKALPLEHWQVAYERAESFEAIKMLLIP
jgi:alcohol dehydrogenase/L-iditol 2-dehydrogenase